MGIVLLTFKAKRRKPSCHGPWSACQCHMCHMCSVVQMFHQYPSIANLLAHLWSILQHVLDRGLCDNMVPQNPAVYHHFALLNGHKIEGSCIHHVWPVWKGHERSWKDKKWHVGQCWSMLVNVGRSQRYKWWCKRCFVEYFIDLPEGPSDSTMTNMTNMTNSPNDWPILMQLKSTMTCH